MANEEPTIPPAVSSAVKSANAEGLSVLQKLAGSKWGGVGIIVWTLAMVGLGFWLRH